ncbi:hypothetical protein GGE35_002915 [Rhizobium cellulosilyticum]|uniref:Uncharacterized protein n=1 Tax=Aliirhizobium cellulosilyticum TaxID=393664 RepID=A0A7W6UZA7_9HYPH|nr:hypothetical protein [Rhizobium cellulosilyticum]MBB4412461.1 hypothetical protein [Rhizobium cellulosilyticum]MBB4447093.1 hypothetical protein [Rhizobium cellulosilyticum]
MLKYRQQSRIFFETSWGRVWPERQMCCSGRFSRNEFANAVFYPRRESSPRPPHEFKSPIKLTLATPIPLDRFFPSMLTQHQNRT